MKILVDADACPVKEIIERLAREHNIPVYLFIDTSHILTSKYSQIIQVSKAPDAVDLALINRTNSGDIVVTQDYGVATMVLGRRAYAIHQNGFLYTDNNIDMLMFERHVSRVSRKIGKRNKAFRKRTKEDDALFEATFNNLIKQVLSDE